MIGALMGLPGKMKTLIDRLTSARAGYLDNLSAGAVAQAATALSSATWTGTKAGYLDAAVSTRLSTAINSIQTGYATANTIGAGEDAYYLDITITSVNTAKSVVLIQPGSATAVTGRLTAATTLRIGSPGNVPARWIVVEFK